MANEPKSGGKAPSFYSVAAEMQSGAGAGAGAGPKSGGADDSAEETKIVATLLEVLKKWETLAKDPKRKEKIQQIATIAKEIQTGMSGGDGKPAPAPAAEAGGGPTPDAAMPGGGGGGLPGGAGGASPGSAVPA
jgi:hypothetical protein